VSAPEKAPRFVVHLPDTDRVVASLKAERERGGRCGVCGGRTNDYSASEIRWVDGEYVTRCYHLDWASGRDCWGIHCDRRAAAKRGDAS